MISTLDLFLKKVVFGLLNVCLNEMVFNSQFEMERMKYAEELICVPENAKTSVLQ